MITAFMALPAWVIGCLIFALGLFVGSFLNVCILRLAKDEKKERSIAFPASHCPQCKMPLAWFDNVPVLSFLWLRGRCRRCQSKISWQYPLVELFTACLFCAIAWFDFLRPYRDHQGFAPHLPVMMVHWIWVSALFVLWVIDARIRILPDEINRNLIPLGPIAAWLWPELLQSNTYTQMLQLYHEFGPEMLSSLNHSIERQFSPGEAFLNSCLGVGAGWLLTWLVLHGGSLLAGKEAMGYGDVKLMAFLGGFLGWWTILVVLPLASLLGTLWILPRMLWTRDRYMAFGPFLILAALMLYFYRWETLLGWQALCDHLLH